ncbi:MAG: clostripain-related cysteine peptidase [Acidobacteriota bacterium]
MFILTLFGFSSIPAQEPIADTKTWHVLGFFDGENAELEKICEYNINQLEEVDSAFVKIIVAFDRTYSPTVDSSVRIYDITQDIDRTEIISNSISIGERDMGLADVLDEFISKYLGERNVLIIKAHGYGIISPAYLKVGYNTPQDPIVISRVLAKRFDRPLEVMIFDSCNMASIEVAYEFKGLVSVMVASQDLMFYSLDASEEITYSSRPGIDYIDLILKLKPHSNPITIGKNVVASFIEIVSKKDALYNRATISALDLDTLDVGALKDIADDLIQGLTNPNTQNPYLDALKDTLETAHLFQPIGRNSILTHYDLDDFLSILEDRLGKNFDRPGACVIQSYSNIYVKKASGLSILFFKDLSRISPVRKKELFEKYSRSRFAEETGWDKLMQIYHDLIAHQ